MAATLTHDEELTHVSVANIEKWDEGPDGTLYVYGKATTPEVDTDEQVVSSAWSGAALKQWLDEAPALRVQHNAQRDPAGSGVKVEVNRDGDGAHWLKAAVDEPVAQRLVKRKHLRAFSVGIARPVIERDITGKARGGIIKGGKIVEVSLVDSPANRSCFLELAKAAKDGSAEFTGKVFGADDLLTKDAGPGVTKAATPRTVKMDLPEDISLSFSPADLAKLLEHRRVAEERQQEDVFKAAGEAETAVLGKDHREFSADRRRELAGRGHALPDGSYPIPDADALRRAAVLARSGHGNVAGARRLIARRAKELGVANPLDENDEVKKSPGAPETAEAEPDVTKDSDDDSDTPPLHHDDGDDDDTDSDADSMDKHLRELVAKQLAERMRTIGEMKAAAPAPTRAPKMRCPSCGKKNKATAKFCMSCGKPMSAEKASKPTPADGVTGHGADPVPEHREPDGPAIEALEHDSGLPTDPDAQAVKVARFLASKNIPAHLGALHDLACPAFDPGDVAKAHPYAHFAAIDVTEWQNKALEMAASAPLDEARKAAMVWQHALALKMAPTPLLDDIRMQVHKAFRDANPGPGSAPTPGEISAQRYHRPYITEGHAAPSPGQDAPHRAPIQPGHIAASQFQRDYITPGHAAESPSNGPRREPAPGPEVPGVPSAVSYTSIQRDNAAQAMSAMHDHLAQTFPDLCPMYAPGHVGQQPSQSRPVPAGVGGPPAHSASKAAEPDVAVSDREVAAGEAAKKLRRRLEKAVFNGDVDLDDARLRLGLEPLGTPVAAMKTATFHAAPAMDPEVIKSAVAEATAPLLKRLEKQDRALREQRETLDAIASQPDPNVTAYKGAAFIKQASAPPAGEPSVSGYAERARGAAISAMAEQLRSSPDPELRTQAWNFLMKEAGLTP